MKPIRWPDVIGQQVRIKMNRGHSAYWKPRFDGKVGRILGIISDVEYPLEVGVDGLPRICFKWSELTLVR